MKIEKKRLMRILGLAVPIVGGMLSQNLLNLVDTAMVGTLGNVALAAVGLGGFSAFLCQSIIMGISVGVQAMAARRKGEGRTDEQAVALNAGLLVVLLLAPIITAAVYQLIPPLYPYLNEDPEVIAEGVPYLQIRILAVIFVGVNMSFRGYWNAVDMAKIYTWTLVTMHSVNIFLNYLLIFGNFGAPELGVKGAGIATSASTAVGTAIYFLMGLKLARKNGFLKSFPPLEEIKTLVRVSIPASTQQLFFSAGLVTLYWIVGKVGTPELAAANVLINVTLVSILPSMALGLASATLVGQALGRKDPEDAKKWVGEVSRIGMGALFLIGVPIWAFPDFIASGFIHDVATLKLARTPMQLVGVLTIFEALSLIMMNSLMGAGDTTRVMRISIVFQWLIFLPCAYVFGVSLGFGLLGIWTVNAIYRLILSGAFLALWRGGRWTNIKL